MTIREEILMSAARRMGESFERFVQLMMKLAPIPEANLDCGCREAGRICADGPAPREGFVYDTSLGHHRRLESGDGLRAFHAS